MQVFRPFNDPHSHEEAVPIIDHSQGKLIRCSRCNSFLNPFYNLQGGRFQRTVDKTFVCNLCDMKNDFPQGMTRGMVDPQESKMAVYDLIVPKEFHIKPMIVPNVLVCIELSANSVNSGKCDVIRTFRGNFAPHSKHAR